MTIRDAFAKATEFTLPISIEASKPVMPVANAQVWQSVAGNFVADLHGKTEASPMALLPTFLAVLGGLAINPHAQHEATKHPLLIWPVIIGTSSKARKGQSLDLVMSAFQQSADGYIPTPQSGITSGEGLIHAIRDAKTDKDGNILLNRNGEPIDEGVQDKRLLLVLPEFATLLQVMGRNGNTTSGNARVAWDGKALQNLNKNSPEKVTKPHITIIAHTTPSELRELYNPREMSNGLGNRFNYFLADRAGKVPSPDIYVPSDGLKADIKKVVQFSTHAQLIQRSAEAEEYWASKYAELSEEASGLVGAMHARDEAYAMRYSCLHALMRCSNTVEIQDIEAALDLIIYNEATLKYQFEATDFDPDIPKLIAAINASPERELSRSEIHKNVFKGHKAASALDDMKLKCVELGAITVRKESTKGNDAEIWSTNNVT
jgi:hypothetical protein